MNHVIDAKSFRSDGSGHENTVKKTQDPAEEAGSGEQKGSGQEGPFFGGEGEEGLLHGDSDKGELV